MVRGACYCGKPIFCIECESCCDHCMCEPGMDPDEEDGDYLDCHMGPDGLCGKAGSEECDFECPYMDEQRIREMKKR